MAQCQVCFAPLPEEIPADGVELCTRCREKKYACCVCGTEFVNQDILDKLPVFQCPSCEGTAIDEMD